VTIASHVHHAADHVLGRSKSTLPQSVRDQRDVVRALVVCREEAAANGRGAEEVE
jgi:hypothetical protein